MSYLWLLPVKRAPLSLSIRCVLGLMWSYKKKNNKKSFDRAFTLNILHISNSLTGYLFSELSSTAMFFLSTIKTRNLPPNLVKQTNNRNYSYFRHPRMWSHIPTAAEHHLVLYNKSWQNSISEHSRSQSIPMHAIMPLLIVGGSLYSHFECLSVCLSNPEYSWIC